MNNFFIPHNKKALDLINSWKDEIFSFLNSKPDTDKNYNHIWTINNNERNEHNGYANFRFQYNDYYDELSSSAIVKRVNIRIETLFENRLNIPAKKIHNYRKADYLIFGDSERLCISQDHSWLENKIYSNRYDFKINNVMKTYYGFNIDQLLNDGLICMLHHGNEYETGYMSIITDTIKNSWDRSGRAVIKKVFQNYNVDTSHIKYVQFDPRTAQSCYYGLKYSTHTDKLGTLVRIASYYSDYSSISPNAIYQRLCRALNRTVETGKLFPCYIPIKQSAIKNMSIDSDTVNKDNELVLYLSQSSDTEIQKCLNHNKTEDIKNYQKNYYKDYHQRNSYQNYQKAEGNRYRKVKKYLQTHSEPKASWSDYEKELFWELSSKINNS